MDQGCVIQQPYDLEVGAGTMHPETFLRVLGPEPYKVAYVQPPGGRPMADMLRIPTASTSTISSRSSSNRRQQMCKTCIWRV